MRTSLFTILLVCTSVSVIADSNAYSRNEFGTIKINGVVCTYYRAQVADIKMIWKDDNGRPLNSIKNLKSFVESQNKKLLFATNGGMYAGSTPCGIYIEDGYKKRGIDRSWGKSLNYYIPFDDQKTNGVFCIDKQNNALIIPTIQYSDTLSLKYATQSGPILLYNGRINSNITPQSPNTKIRSGVGVTSVGEVIFIISNDPINFYDLATLFKEKFDCKNALYLDGVVSRMFISNGDLQQVDGIFGVMIYISK